MTTPLPDPGNAPPEEWSEDMTDDEYGAVIEEVNTVAMSLPPLPDDLEN